VTTPPRVACVPARLDGLVDAPAVDRERLREVRQGPGVEQPRLDPQRMRELDEALHPAGKCTCAGEGRCEWCRREARYD
jgi:hypothetical protein